MEAFDNFFDLTESDIRDTTSDLSKRTTTQGRIPKLMRRSSVMLTIQGRINFGMRRVKYTLGIMHWAQDESRCSCTESLTWIADAEEYKPLWGTALDQAMLLKVESDQANTIIKAEYPGKFKDKITWT